MSGGRGAGSFPGPVGGAVHEDLMAGVDESVEKRFRDDWIGNSGYQSLGARLLVKISGLAAIARSETRS